MNIVVIGATGMVGSAATEELLNRGHRVTGIARDVTKLPSRDGLTAKAADIMRFDELADVIRGQDAVICAYSAGHGLGSDIYQGVVEAGWRIKRALRKANVPYLLNVGGASSLWLPGGFQQLEDPSWPAWYFNSAPPEHLAYLHRVSGAAVFGELAASRRRILADASRDPLSDFPEEHLRQFVQQLGRNFTIGAAGRAQLELFLHDRTFRWSFLSPPFFMRPGPRTGVYRTTIEQMPLESGVPAGIAVADLAVAIADECEKQQFVWKHWSAARLSRAAD